jgi:hypothetical protein
MTYTVTAMITKTHWNTGKYPLYALPVYSKSLPLHNFIAQKQSEHQKYELLEVPL